MGQQAFYHIRAFIKLNPTALEPPFPLAPPPSPIGIVVSMSGTCTVQRSHYILYLKTAHGTLRMWFYTHLAVGLKMKGSIVHKIQPLEPGLYNNQGGLKSDVQLYCSENI